MRAFVVLIPSEEGATPEVVGAFDNHAHAEQYIDSDAVEGWVRSQTETHGGNPSVTIVSFETATHPDAWLEAQMV